MALVHKLFISTPSLQGDSVGGVGQGTGVKAPSLASFLRQRANQVLGASQRAETVPNQVQMDQLQCLHSSLSLPSNDQGISVLV